MQERASAPPALVRLHALDSINWLRSRKDFEISSIQPRWIARELANASPENATRGLLVASIVNLGALADFGPTVGIDPDEARQIFDEARPLPAETVASLKEQLKIYN